MRILVGTDHGGFELKEEIVKRLAEHGYRFEDCGVHESASVDYPDIAQLVCDKLLAGEGDCAILFCGTGIGISIAANKIHGIRAALVSDTYSAARAREHNNANVICLGGRVIGPDLAWDICESYLKMSFAGGRHQRRVDKIAGLEERTSASCE